MGIVCVWQVSLRRLLPISSLSCISISLLSLWKQLIWASYFFWRALRGARRWFSWQATSVLQSPTANHTRFWCWGERLSCRSRKGLVFWFPIRYVPSQRLPQELKTQHPFVDCKINKKKKYFWCGARSDVLRKWSHWLHCITSFCHGNSWWINASFAQV